MQNRLYTEPVQLHRVLLLLSTVYFMEIPLFYLSSRFGKLYLSSFLTFEAVWKQGFQWKFSLQKLMNFVTHGFQLEDGVSEENHLNFSKTWIKWWMKSKELAYENLTKVLPFGKRKGKFASSNFWKMFGVPVTCLNISLVVESQSSMVMKCPFNETKVPLKRHCPL